MNLLGDLEPAEELVFTLGLCQLVAQARERLPFGKELAYGEISFGQHRLHPGEPVFLPLWLRYYSRHFAAEDLYVLDHDGTDGSAAEAARRCGCRLVPVHRDRSYDHRWLCETVCRRQALRVLRPRRHVFVRAVTLRSSGSRRRYPNGHHHTGLPR